MRGKKIKFAEIRTFGEFYFRFAFLLEFNGKMWYNYKAAENTAVKKNISHILCGICIWCGLPLCKEQGGGKTKEEIQCQLFQ